MSYFSYSRSNGRSSAVVEPWCQVVAAWVLAMVIFAGLMWAFTGGRFSLEIHSVAAAGPVVAFLPDSILFSRGPFLGLLCYLVSLGAAFLMARLPESGVWLIIWILSGLAFLYFRFAIAMQGI